MTGQAPNPGSGQDLPPVQAIQAIANSVAGLPVEASEGLPQPYGTIVAAVQAADSGHRVQALEKTLAFYGLDAGPIMAAAMALDLRAHPPEPVPDVAIPRLPSGAVLDPALGKGVGGWVDRYVKYALAVSPATPALFHESAALWLVSAAIARRLYVPMSFDDVFPNLWIAWIAGTTIWTKTTALNKAENIARRLFDGILLSGYSTPEGLLSEMSGEKPKNWEQMTYLDDWEERRRFAGQRGILMDEMSLMLASASRDYNQGLIEIYLKLYDCHQSYTRLTRGQGLLTVKSSYLSFLGASTPTAIKPYISDAKLWAMGYWPRFALLTPDTPVPVEKDPVSADPAPLMEELGRLFGSLPQPEDKESGPVAPEPIAVLVDQDAYQAWDRYYKALKRILRGESDDKLSGWYGRLQIQLLKVAMLLAALDWDPGRGSPRMTVAHLAKGMEITERWRASFHRTLELGEQETTGYADKRDRVIRQIKRHLPRGATFRDICHGMRNVNPDEIEQIVKQLLKIEELRPRDDEPPANGGRPTVRYFPANWDGGNGV